MSLRVRCPKCRTILRVPAGARPKCPGCGFAGKSGPSEATHVEQVTWATGQESQAVESVPEAWAPAGTAAAGADDPWAQPGVTWDTPGSASAAAAAAPGADDTWAEPEQGWAVPEASEGASDADAAWGAPVEAPKKRGWFGRKK